MSLNLIKRIVRNNKKSGQFKLVVLLSTWQTLDDKNDSIRSEYVYLIT